MTDSQILKAIEGLTAKCTRLEARCAALDAVACMLAMRQSIPRAQIEAALDKVAARAHQRLLERAEDIDPGLAASLDRRALGDDLGL